MSSVGEVQDAASRVRAVVDGDGREPGVGRLSLVGAINLVLQRLPMVITVGVATAVLVVTVLLVLPRTYSSNSSFIPQSRRGPSSLAGLAAQFGVAVPAADPGESPAFYSDLIMTREILGPVSDGRYWVPSGGWRDSVTLIEVFDPVAKTPALRREGVIQKLRRTVGVDVSLKTGAVNLNVESRYPELAMQINRRILDRVNAFNLGKRQSQAASERHFVENRLDEVRAELRAAEDHLQGFLQANRDYHNSPSLAFAHDRLEREVSMKQQLYTTLAQSYEQAKIDEIRDSPMITIIEEPVVPVLPDARGTVRKGALALAAGFLLGLFVVFGRYAVGHGHAGNPDELRQFRVLARQVVGRILRPWRKHRSPRVTHK